MNRRRAIPLILAGATAGCAPPREAASVQAIIGAVLVRGDGTAIEDSVVLVRDGRILAAGTRAGIPIPAGSRKTDGRGKYLVPAAEGEAIEAGRTASFALLGQDPRRAGAFRPQVEKMMVDGEWADPPPSR